MSGPPKLHDEAELDAAHAVEHHTVAAPAAGPDDLEPQLKYERLGADVKDILNDASATALCLSEKVLALGTSLGNIHILDYSGNEVKRFSLHSQAVRHISFDDKAEYVASCCGEDYVSVSGLYTDETNKYTFKRPITVVALDPRYASRKTHEFVTGDVRGRLKLSSQGWLGRSDTVLHQGEGPIRAVAWQGSILAWASDVGTRVYDTNQHQMFGSMPRPRGGRFPDCCECRLYLHQGEQLFVAWPDCIQVATLLSATDAVSGQLKRRLKLASSVPADFFCLGAVPHGDDLAVLAYVTDQDPDQDQVGLTRPQAAGTAAAAAAVAADDGATAAEGEAGAAAAEDVQLQEQQQEQHGEQREEQEHHKDPAAHSDAAADPDKQQQQEQQQQQQQEPEQVEEGRAADSAKSAAAPINIPQPVRRPQRAANAVVHSPGGPSLLEAAAAAAVASATAAAPASANPGAAGADSTTAAAAAAASSSSSASPSPAGSRKLTPVVSFAASEGRGSAGPGVQGSASSSGVQGSASLPPRPGNWGRSVSFMSRPSNSSASGAAQEAYTPPGVPLRPELRILSLQNPSGSAPHNHPEPSPSSSGGVQGLSAHPASCCFEKASDALSVAGYQAYLPRDYVLVPSYGQGMALPSAATSSTQRRARRQQQQGLGSSRTSGGAAASTASSAAAAAAAAAAAGRDEDAVAAAKDAAAADVSSSAAQDGDAAAAAAAADVEQAGDGELLAEGLGEFMYFIVSPKDIVIGRHRDTEDRISWLLAAGRFTAALALAEADSSLPRAVFDTVVQAYLEYLTAAGKWSAAADSMPQLLKDQAPQWERWLYVFAQARQLPLLAPVLPTQRPTLHSHCYDLVLQALLVDPAHHGLLLSLVQAWPASCFHPTAIIDAIAQRMQRPGGESRELWQALAVLYKGQGRPDLSLAVYLQLQLPSVFDFIQEHSLLSYLDEKAYLLMAIDEAKALDLLAGHLDMLPPAAVVPGLLDAMAVAEGDGDAEGHKTWRRRLFNYLDKVFTVDPSAAGEYAELCVHLYADYCPARLMDFLQGSQTYPLEAALQVAEQREMVDEQVYILSRMGNSRAALALIIERLQDIPRAIEFVRLQRDEELIEELIDWALRSADTTGQLLDHIGGNINPLRVIQKIPEGMSITSLRDRLRHIIADFRTQTSLREGCNAILRSDCLKLVNKLQMEVKRAMPVVWLQRVGAHGMGPAGVHLAAAAAAAADAAADHQAAAAPASSSWLGRDAATDTQQQQVRVSGAGVSTAAGAASHGLGAAGGSGASPVKLQRGAARAAASFLPPGAAASKGPQWLKYNCSSGKAMAMVSSQDVPAAAMLEASRGVGSSRSASPLPWGGPTGAEQPAHQPVGVWIGNSQVLAKSTLLAAGDAAAAGLQKQIGGSAAGSRRSSKQHKQQAPQPALASLVAA